MTIVRAEPLFRDRVDAGRQLAAALERFRSEDPVVFGLPRGGVPVAFEVARALGAPLDVLVVRKLGAPLHRELGVGALAEGGVVVLDEEAVRRLGIEPDEMRAIAAEERRELERRVEAYRGGREPEPVAGRTAIVVDDGLATGGTAIAACRALRDRGAARVVLAVPVAPPGAERRLGEHADELVCLSQPEAFFAVGAFYEEFGQTGDDEVRALLAAARAGDDAPAAEAGERHNGGLYHAGLTARAVEIPADGLRLPGVLRSPPAPTAIVLFAHGSGSSRSSPRNIQVATALGAAGQATLLFDLLDERETTDRANVFDVDLLAGRLKAATEWARADAEVGELPLGYFGASTGAAAALVAAADLGSEVGAVVSRGGRPDLAGDRLAEVVAPTLLIVGGDDWQVLELNERAAESLRCPHELAVVPHAGHLFEEPGALERVASLAAGWFDRHLVAEARRAA